MKNNIIVRIAESKEDKKLADNIVVQYHSYVSSAKTVGRCIKYLIEYNDEIVGTFWIGSGFKPTPKSILNYFNVSQKEFDKMFNTVADNKRFCMIKSIPNLGSTVLKLIRNRAKNDWFDKYGDNLVSIVTTIGNGKKGSVYLSDNWEVLGSTAGLPKDRKSVSMKWDSPDSIKDKFSKPDGHNKKTIIITSRLF